MTKQMTAKEAKEYIARLEKENEELRAKTDRAPGVLSVRIGQQT